MFPKQSWKPKTLLAVMLILSASVVLLPCALAQTSDRADHDSLSQKIDRVIANRYFGPKIPLSSDSEFHRRIYLDLLGRGPSTSESEAFLKRIEANPDARQTIRNEVIDNLLELEEFSRYYAKVLDVIFTERREVIGPLEFRAWLRQWLHDRRPLNELCTEILAADGTGESLRPAASFMINRQAEPNLVTRDVGRIFFGRDVQCAQCHDHPLISDYEQSEYFGILSFVNRTYLFQDEKRGNKPFLGEKGEGSLEFASVFRPEAGKSVAQPVLPMAMAMDTEPDFADATDAYVVAPEKNQRGVPRYSRRQQLAVLATHPENQSFNRNLANRLWAIMLGKGVVHPVDMHHSDNPPASAELLRLLSDELVECDYELRTFLRQIARSDTYQRSVMIPDLQTWEGPTGGTLRLDEELLQIEIEHQKLKPLLEELESELALATKQVQKAQADVSKLQTQVDDAKKQLQQLTEQRDKTVAKLTELKNQQAIQQQRIESFQAASQEADKAIKITPEDQELVAARTLLATRLTSASEAKTALDNAVQEQLENVDDASFRVDDQRNRIHALTNRRLALAEFVVEARGVERRVRKQMQSVIDQQTDCDQQKIRVQLLQKWIELRDQARTIANEETRNALSSLERELVESWQRIFAFRSVRSLNPEQLTGATYAALELDQPIRTKALADWNTQHQNDPSMRDDIAKKDLFVNAAVAINMWDTVEDPIVERFSAPAGNPQDGFFATVDQALMIQNDPTFQSWLKANDGTLVARLSTIEDSNQVAHQLYLSILCRRPAAEEIQRVSELLNQNATDRVAMIQELVWGLLASTEFRFSM